MEASEREELYNGIRNFREKEVTIGLTEEERNALAQLLKQAEADMKQSVNIQVDYNEKQLQAPVIVEAIRQVTFIESPVKQKLLERIMKKEQLVYYELHVPQRTDQLSYEWSYQFTLEVKKFIEEIGLGDKWSTLLSATMEMSPRHILNKEEMEWLNLLPDPNWCLRVLEEVPDLKALAKKHSEEMHDSILWLKEQWEEGYQIYIDCTELNYIQID
ncbi:hypothetical protein MHZ95_11465 [Sporosarcina sp. ACRSM]|uniref:hypothetical protein n=1 Tax=Sporosarcina sp. ACRSM TaxID=2918216 RepID=UPI001EF5100F|nr:hypothetical protein [Sporosarcina sp. ACRSM]MCG7335899.1 hypothetical protein [Sporosarcina sp. ACRSM]